MQPCEERLRVAKSFQHPGEGSGEAKVEDRVEAEEDRLVALLARGVLPDVAVIELIVGGGNLAEEEEVPFAEGIGIFANIRAKARAGKFPHVLDGIHPKTIDIRFTDPIAVRCNKNVDQLRARRIVIAIIILEYRDVPVLEFRIRIVAVWAVNLATTIVEGFLNAMCCDPGGSYVFLPCREPLSRTVYSWS